MATGNMGSLLMNLSALNTLKRVNEGRERINNVLQLDLLPMSIGYGD